MNALLEAIYNDDRRRAETLLAGDGSLSQVHVDDDRLYECQIAHWLYTGDTAMHLAAAGYRVEIMGLLLRADANPNSALNRRKSTPLHYAADGFVAGPGWDAAQQIKAIECMLNAGAILNLQDGNGATALHRAVRTRCADAVQFLLYAGCNPEGRNKSGSTAFHLAVQNTGRGGTATEEAKVAQRRIIESFLSFGVKSSLTDGNGKSVKDVARSDWVRGLLSDHAV